MPPIDPNALKLQQYEGGRLQVFALLDLWPYPSSAPYHRHRTKRVVEIQRQLDTDGRACRWCGDMIPLHRPVTARYCCVGCRRRAWWRRRKARTAAAWSFDEAQQAVLRLQIGGLSAQQADILREGLRSWEDANGPFSLARVKLLEEHSN